ncbi:MAG: MFS transporter [Pseudomonadota bacterium]|jgi:ACS family hexuronate transporter-like MFS transporter
MGSKDTYWWSRDVRYRWVICGLLFLATTCNYMDRQVLGILAPELQREFGWSELAYGHIVTSFQTAYAIGLVCSGWFVDRFGSRFGLSLAVFLWSLASMAHGFARNVAHFAYARFGLGLAESANFPASIKSVAEWFPERERPLAIGILNCGANVGAVLAPIIVPLLTVHYGWQAAFIGLGAVGFIWLALAAVFFHGPPAKADSCHDDSSEANIQRLSMRSVITWRATWTFATAKFLTDPVWWFYLYWTPKYLSTTYGLGLAGLGMPLVVIYLAADVGSIGGGWCSGWLARRGVPEAAARLRVMLGCSLAAISVISLARADNIVLAIVLLSVAAAAHQGWSANLFAIASTTVPKRAVGSVVGFGGMAGAVGGILLAEVAGHVLEYTGSYVPLFVICAFAYLVAWSVVRSLPASKVPLEIW